MGENAPERPGTPAGLNVVLVVLVIALAAAGAYIVHLRGQLAQYAAAPLRPAAPAPPPEARAPEARPPVQRPAAAAPPTPAGPPTEDAIAAMLSPVQRQAMVATLKNEATPERKVWFQVQANNPDTAAVQIALQRVFEEAGWPTDTVRKPYPLKSGIFLLAADDQPPGFVDTVSSAFTAASIDVQYLTGYRAFFESRKQQNPSWVGPELAADQPFIIVIGSKPTPKAQGAGG